jgi:rhodanese-related sulfurtransferase
MQRSTGSIVEIRPLEAYELRRMLELGDPVTVLDVRTLEDYQQSDAEVAGALRVVPSELERHLTDLPRGKPVVTCGSDGRDGAGERVAEQLIRKGFTEVRPVKGGFEAFIAAGGPVMPRSSGR